MSAQGRRRSAAGDLVGRDFTRVRLSASRVPTRPLGWLLVTAFACAFAIAALRIDILRVRYALGEAVSEEKELVQQLRRQAATLETLRDPARLGELAHERGFRRPDRILEIDGGEQVYGGHATRRRSGEAATTTPIASVDRGEGEQKRTGNP